MVCNTCRSLITMILTHDLLSAKSYMYIFFIFYIFFNILRERDYTLYGYVRYFPRNFVPSVCLSSVGNVRALY